jgi:hypothetical protein
VSIHLPTSSLTRLAQTLDADLGDVDELPIGESASLVRVLRNGEVAIRSLDGEHPFEALLGFVAPDDWEVFGVIAPGWATYYGEPTRGERRRVRVIHLASRVGDEASVLRFAGETEPQTMNEEASPGRVADCIRRALDLPTPPAAEESLLAFWMDRVLQKLAERTHPSFSGGLLDVGDVDAFVAPRPASWSDERWRVVESGGSILMDGSVAAWMDDGMFARYVLSELADVEVALAGARRACTPDAWSYLLQTFADAALEVADGA